ncbi:serine protease 1-like [Teleopsis dalmanni]|uniref:serine protease 1-like n=1 Tax=Teleopsis dalmanni TaxID=139649 RepID=UPI000D32C4EE|nr:serine protease 1-like [Teleopsis dalmanni]
MKLSHLVVVIFSAIVAVSANKIPFQSSAIYLRDLTAAQGRITNGENAAEGQFPYQVALTFTSAKSGGWSCGGSIIGHEWILTAAHCTKGASSVDIYMGSTIRSNPRLAYTVDSNNFIQHKGYNSLTTTNDISLIRIPLTSFNEYISSIALPKITSVYSSYTGQKAIASGWGLTTDSYLSAPASLQYAFLQVIDNSKCVLSYGPLTVVSSTICTSTTDAISTCQGDSGGPLVLLSTQELIGVTSFVNTAGCLSGRPAGFARVTSYLDWIKENTGIYY